MLFRPHVQKRIDRAIEAAGYTTIREYFKVEYIYRKKSGAEICRNLGIANMTLYTILEHLNMPRPIEMSENTKYEDLDKPAILEMLKAGSLMRECAAIHNCSIFYIHRVKREAATQMPLDPYLGRMPLDHYREITLFFDWPSDYEIAEAKIEADVKAHYPAVWKFAHMKGAL